MNSEIDIIDWRKMKVQINENEYEYFDKIVDQPDIRNNFMKLINDTFCFDFREWYKKGYWTEKYEPHVLVKDNEVVATVTVNFMKYFYENEEKNYIQLGGVLTKKEYQNKGLSKWLTEQIISRYQNKCDQIFLLSDDVAKDFYPKFGFKKAVEYISSYEWKGINENPIKDREKTDTVRKLNVEIPNDKKILLECYAKANPISDFTSRECEELLLFYGMEFRKNCLYYFSELGLVVFANFTKKGLIIEDVYGNFSFDSTQEKNNLLIDIIKYILKYNEKDKQACHVELGFTPCSGLSDFYVEELVEKDDTLYILEGKENLFQQNKLRFPILSHN